MEDDSEFVKLSEDVARYRQLLSVCNDAKTMEILRQLIDEAQARLDARKHGAPLRYTPKDHRGLGDKLDK